MLLLSARSGALAARIGPRLQMSVGPVVIGAGLFLFARVGPSAGPSGNYVTEVLPAVLVFGFGLAINVAPLTSTVLAAAPDEVAGMASAVNNDVARAAGLIAVAVLPAAAGLTGSSYLIPHEFSAGFRTASFISGALCLLAGVLAALHHPQSAPGRSACRRAGRATFALRPGRPAVTDRGAPARRRSRRRPRFSPGLTRRSYGATSASVSGSMPASLAARSGLRWWRAASASGA